MKNNFAGFAAFAGMVCAALAWAIIFGKQPDLPQREPVLNVPCEQTPEAR